MKTLSRNIIDGNIDGELYFTKNTGEEIDVKYKGFNPECENCSENCFTGVLDNCKKCPWKDSIHIDIIMDANEDCTALIEACKADFIELAQEAREER